MGNVINQIVSFPDGSRYRVMLEKTDKGSVEFLGWERLDDKE